MRMLDIIAKKRQGGAHSDEEIRFIVQAAAAPRPEVPDYQMAAWLMAVCCRGMSEAETAALTREMARSGARLELGGLGVPRVDKHSTGGVGDGVSLALAPLIASAGLWIDSHPVPDLFSLLPRELPAVLFQAGAAFVVFAIGRRLYGP